MEYFEAIGDILSYVVPGLFFLIVVIAAIRVTIKAFRGERIDVPAVGVVKDLPGSVTGLNKHLDDEMLNLNQQNKKDGE